MSLDRPPVARREPGGQPRSIREGAIPAPVSARRLASASVLAVSLRVCSAFLGAVVIGVLGRGLSHAEYGVLAVIIAFDAMAKSLGDLGTSQIGIRMMSEAPEQRGRIAAALVLAQTLGGLAAIAIFSVATLLVFATAGDRLAAFIVIASFALSGFTKLQTVSDSQLRPQLAAAAVLIQSMAWLASVIILSAIGAPLWGYCLALVGTNLTAVSIVAVGSRRLVQLEWSGAVQAVPSILRQSLLLGVAGTLAAAYYKLDGVILFHSVGAAKASYYSAAYRFLDVVQFIPATLCVGVIPVIVGAFHSPPADVQRYVQRLYTFLVCALLVLGTAGAIVGGASSRSLLHVTYGAKYVQAAGLLTILLTALPFVMVNVGLLAVVTAYHITSLYLWTVGCATVLNVTANVLLIPRYGAAAAAWTELGTEFIVTVTLLTGIFFRLRLRPPLRRIASLFGLAAGSVAMLNVTSRFVPWPRPVNSLILGVAITLGVVALRVIPLSEVRALLSHRQLLDQPA